MPWVAARNGKVDIVYYGSNQAQDDTSAVWNVYDAQSTGRSFTGEAGQQHAEPASAPCARTATAAAATASSSICSRSRRIRRTNKAAIIYTDTTIDTYTSSGTHELPEIVLAFEKEDVAATPVPT